MVDTLKAEDLNAHGKAIFDKWMAVAEEMEKEKEQELAKIKEVKTEIEKQKIEKHNQEVQEIERKMAIASQVNSQQVGMETVSHGESSNTLQQTIFNPAKTTPADKKIKWEDIISDDRRHTHKGYFILASACVVIFLLLFGFFCYQVYDNKFVSNNTVIINPPAQTINTPVSVQNSYNFTIPADINNNNNNITIINKINSS